MPSLGSLGPQSGRSWFGSLGTAFLKTGIRVAYSDSLWGPLPPPDVGGGQPLEACFRMLLSQGGQGGCEGPALSLFCLGRGWGAAGVSGEEDRR